MKRLLLLVSSVSLVACSNNDPTPDASVCGAVKELHCYVTVVCDNATSHRDLDLCDKSNDGPTIEEKAIAKARTLISCGGGAPLAATCTAPLDAITCPIGFDLEDTSVCIPGSTYGVDTSEICSDLPDTDNACGHACDREALYEYTTDGVFTTYTCETATSHKQYVVGAAPRLGNGARLP
jgi:hypothetical protein